MFRKRLTSMALALLVVLSAMIPVGASPAFGTETAEDTAAFIAEMLVNYYEVSSLQYALIDSGEIIISGSATAPGIEEAITEDTIYGIGSVSKIYTAAAVMHLVDAGTVDLDAPVTQYVPEFSMKDERYKDITVRMLLNHSSGIYGTTYANAFMFDTYDEGINDRFLEHLSGQNLKAAPGEIAVYCNDGFVLAEIVVERVTGMSFSEYLRRYITVGASNTYTPASGIDRENLAAAYFNGTKAPVDVINMIGTGGIYSTASDLVILAQAFMDDSNGILSGESVDAMAAYEFNNSIWPEIADNIIDFGLGWDSVRLFPFNRYNIQALTKGGDTLFYHSALVVLPEYNMAMAVVMSGGASSFATAMASSVLLDLLLEKGEIDEILPDATFEQSEPMAIPADYDGYFGYYAAPGTIALFDKNDDGDTLAITSPYAPDLLETVLYVGDGLFMSEDFSFALRFAEESNGHIYIQQYVYMSLPYVGQLAMNIYSHQKIKIGILDEDVAEVWANRSNNMYLLVSEAYNSQAYTVGGAGMIIAAVVYLEELGDYLFQNQIIDANTAVNIIQIPVLAGRDSTDYIFYEDDGVEYLYAASLVFADAASFANIYPGRVSHLTINEKGHSKWYYTGEAAGKTMTVDMPENSAFVVYDQEFTCVFSSYIEQSNSVVLPENGTIVFTGEAGARFNITLE